MIRIPYTDLSDDALTGVVDTFVLREGTDYGHNDVELDAKRLAVRRQLAAGQAEIVFDTETGTTNILPL